MDNYASYWISLGLILVYIYYLRFIVLVSEGTAAVVERFGRAHRVLYAGRLHFLVPLVDRVAHTVPVGHLQQRHVATFTTTLADNHQVTCELSMFYKVIDPLKAAYALANREAYIYEQQFKTMKELNKCTLQQLKAAVQNNPPKWEQMYGLELQWVLKMETIDDKPASTNSRTHRRKSGRV